jgi:hypothetical protein
MAKRAHEMFDSVNEKLIKKIGLKIACTNPCPYCCSEPVSVFEHELDLLVNEKKKRARMKSYHSSNASKS